MWIKTKYKIGQVVKFFDRKEMTVGLIVGICAEIHYTGTGEINYAIEVFGLDYFNCARTVHVDEGSVYKKLNKRAFEKAYAEECAKILAKRNEQGDEDDKS